VVCTITMMVGAATLGGEGTRFSGPYITALEGSVFDIICFFPLMFQRGY
jgi:hypothetical protein